MSEKIISDQARQLEIDLDDERWKELFQSHSRSTSRPLTNHQAPTIDEIFKLESGVEVWEICGSY